MKIVTIKAAQKIDADRRNSPRMLVTPAREFAYRKKKGDTKVPMRKPELTSDSALVD